ncbi:MAG: UbiX family flavin prenyltransferase [Desulfocapsa sp.]|nr:UbiX family flavin prenyltransferase [Desulfocapsa sp.]
MKKILVAVTGASAMLYLQSFLEMLEKEEVLVHGICSEAGTKVLELEHDSDFSNLPAVSKWFDCRDFAAPPASGSAGYDAMVVIPCSMGTLGAIASGITSNLIHRAADVMLKENKKLILVTRETPLNRTHIKNMLAVHDAGAVICPPHPGFYLKPKTLEEAAMTFSWRLGDHLGLVMEGRKRWGSNE